MTSPSRQPGWKRQARPTTPSSTPAGNQGWQNPTSKRSTAPTAVPWWQTKKGKISLVITGMVSILVAIVIVMLWPRPERPPLLVILDAGYEDNLAVPQNVAGRHTADELAAWADAQNATLYGKRKRIDVKRGTLLRNQQEVVSTFGTSLIDRITTKPPEKVVVYVAAHGMAAIDNLEVVSPCLIPNDYDPGAPTELIKLDVILEALKTLDAKTKKLVVLDVSGFRYSWSLGQYRSTFVEALQSDEYKDRIQKIPNLTILVSTTGSQQSWVMAERNMSAFGFYFVEGLKGAAYKLTKRSDGRIDAKELSDFVTTRVERWVRHNRNRVQQPQLIDPGTNAGKLQLAYSYDNYKETPLPEQKAVFEELTASWNLCKSLWEECNKLEKETPPPWTMSPLLWRKYQDMLLRVEELAMAGDRSSAEKLRGSCEQLAKMIRDKQSIPMPSGALTMAMPDTLGIQLTDSQMSWLKPFRAMVEKADFEAAQDHLRLLTKTTGSSYQKQLLLVRAAEAVVIQAKSDPQRNLTATRDLLTSLDGSSARRPTEAHLLAMYQVKEHGAVEDLMKENRWDLLRKVLEIRLLAEQAAMSTDASNNRKPTTPIPPYSELVMDWIRPIIDQADKDRRLGQDLLCTSLAAHWKTAEEHLNRAESSYKSVVESSEKIRRALYERDRILASMPAYTKWVAESPLTRPEQVESLRELWKQIHQLNGMLENVPLNDMRAVVNRLGDMALDVDRSFTSLQKDIIDTLRSRYSDSQDHYHEIERFLILPFSDSLVRYRLLENIKRISWQLNKDSERGTEAPGSEKTIPELQAATRRQARLAMAALGDPDRAMEVHDRELKNPQVNEIPLKLLVRLGQKIVQSSVDRAKNAQTETELAAKTDLSSAEKKLRQTAIQARLCDGWMHDIHVKIEPVMELRKVLLHNLLCWQAERTFQDHWASEPSKQNQGPYYRLAGLQFLDDAVNLLKREEDGNVQPIALRLKRSREVREILLNANPFIVEWATTARTGKYQQGQGRLFITDEPYVYRHYRLGGPANVPGHPVHWTEYGKGFDIEATTLQRKPEELGRSFAQKIAATGEISKRPTLENQKHAVRGYFRGHVAEAPTLVDIMGEPDLLFVAQPVPKLARIAVRLDRKGVQALAEQSIISIVLDVSGSMRRIIKETNKSRWETARQSLREVLSQLPSGVTVSLHTFAAKEHISEADPRGIRHIFTQKSWVRSKENVEEQMQKIDKLTPFDQGFTPLMRAIKTARDAMPSAGKGLDKKTRTLIVLTDGGDNYFYDKNNPDKDLKAFGGETVESFLKTCFSGRDFEDIKVQVIGFDIDPDKVADDEKRAFKELPLALAKLRPTIGVFTDARQSKFLTRYLLGAMLRSRFKLEPAVRQPDYTEEPLYGGLTSIGENLSWLVVNPGEYTLHTPAIPALSQPVRLLAGDALILDLEPKYGTAGVRRHMFAASPEVKMNHRKVQPAEEKWLYGVLQNERPRTRSGDLVLMTTLEKDLGEANRNNHLQVIHPRWVWYEVFETPNQKEMKGPIRVATLSDYPAPAWGIEVPRWRLETVEGGRAEAVPVTLRAWWTETPLAYLPKASGWIREPGEQLLTQDERPLVTRLPEDKVILESVTLEECTIHMHRPAIGQKLVPESTRDCLVVRLRFPPDRGPFFVQVGDAEWSRGQAHRYYPKAGKYTGIFWPVNKDSLDKVKEMHVYSVRELKERKGTQRVDLDLGKPDAHKVRPPVDGGGIRLPE